MDPLSSRIMARMAGGTASILGAFSFVVISPCATNRRVAASSAHSSFTTSIVSTSCSTLSHVGLEVYRVGFLCGSAITAEGYVLVLEGCGGHRSGVFHVAMQYFIDWVARRDDNERCEHFVLEGRFLEFTNFCNLPLHILLPLEDGGYFLQVKCRAPFGLEERCKCVVIHGVAGRIVVCRPFVGTCGSSSHALLASLSLLNWTCWGIWSLPTKLFILAPVPLNASGCPPLPSCWLADESSWASIMMLRPRMKLVRKSTIIAGGGGASSGFSPFCHGVSLSSLFCCPISLSWR
jgi:hypothetical protein